MAGRHAVDVLSSLCPKRLSIHVFWQVSSTVFSEYLCLLCGREMLVLFIVLSSSVQKFVFVSKNLYTSCKEFRSNMQIPRWLLNSFPALN